MKPIKGVFMNQLQWTKKFHLYAWTLLCLSAKGYCEDPDQVCRDLGTSLEQLKDKILEIDGTIAAVEKKTQASSSKSQDESIQVLASARGCDMNGPTATVEFLFWRAFEDQLLIAINQGSTVSKPLDFRPSVKPGFRVGIGYNLPYDDWSLDVLYTYYYSHKSIKSTGTIYLIQDSEIGTGPQFDATFLHSSWRLHYNILDGNLGRSFYVSPNLSLQPFISIRGAWIRQKIKSFSTGTDTDDTGAASASIFESVHYTGVGPRIGIDTHWLFGKTRFGFQLNAAGSLLYSRYKTYSNILTITEDGTSGLDIIIKNKPYHSIRPNAEFYAGLDYSRCWPEHDFFLRYYLGYSLSYWWSQNQMVTPSNLTPNGDLGLHGLTTGFEFDF